MSRSFVSKGGPAALAAAIVALVVLGLLSACGSQAPSEGLRSETGSSIEPGADSAGPGIVAEEGAAGAPDSGAVANQAADVAVAERKLVFIGDMALRVEDVAKTMAAARQWAESHGGFVESEGSSGGEGSQGGGAMVLRVPTKDYEATRDHMRSLATEVLNDHSQREDVTSRYADMDARLTNLKAAERELQALLTEVRENGGKTEDILSVYNEVTAKRGEIDALQAQLNALGEQVALSTLRLELQPPPVSVAEVSESWQPGEVFRKALADVVGAFQWLADALIYLVTTAPFWLLFVLLAWAVWRLLRRARRKQTPEAPGSSTEPAGPAAPPPVPGA